MTAHKTIKLLCIDCGKVFTAKARNALRCEKCRCEHNLYKARENKQKNKIAREQAKRPQPKTSLRKILREIEQYNKEHKTRLSYGQYIAMIEMRDINGCKKLSDAS